MEEMKKLNENELEAVSGGTDSELAENEYYVCSNDARLYDVPSISTASSVTKLYNGAVFQVDRDIYMSFDPLTFAIMRYGCIKGTDMSGWIFDQYLKKV